VNGQKKLGLRHYNHHTAHDWQRTSAETELVR